MTLSAYKQKRSFRNTPEPEGGTPAGDQLRFVVQKHHASSLHYDFRLEMKDRLKSWAVPKGPSLNPKDKRLAMEVEDHPYDYKDFEGVIPEGNYGAGPVIVWDEGAYEPLEAYNDKQSAEAELLKQWKSGSLKFRLHGQKLKGAYALVKMKGQEDNAWLLIKHNDRYASMKDVTRQGKSVRSGRSLEQLVQESAPASQANKRIARSSEKGSKQSPPAGKEKANAGKAVLSREVSAVIKKAPDVLFPRDMPPMLATLADGPFDAPGWAYEIKWDGYRAIAYRNGKITELRSRSNQSFKEKFYPVYNALKKWDVKAVVDGEVVALNHKGIPAFHQLQNWKSEEDGDLYYYIFDLLWYEGKDMTGLPLSERKTALKALLPADHPVLKGSFSTPASGTDFFNAAVQLGLEGIIAKRQDSLYYPGERSKAWIKIKSRKEQEAVICGYTKNKSTSRPFSSLLLGIYKENRLYYAGKVGTGFKESEQKEMLRLFRPLITESSPFPRMPGKPGNARFRNPVPHELVWLRPELVCEIHFTEVTAEGIFRHPVFIALREDKIPETVVLEKQVSMNKKTKRNASPKEDGLPKKTDQEPSSPAKNQARRINGHLLSLTNLDKVLWPEQGYTKGDMLDYYQSVSAYILPHLKDRPQSLHRFPNGIGRGGFYQKDVTGKVPEWIAQYPYKVEGERKQKHYMLCNSKAALLYMANLAAIEMNPWSSTIRHPEQPSWCMLDLDPDKSNSFDQVIEVAQAIFQLLEELKIPFCCKTSGATGLHIYIPLGAKYTYEQSQLFARWVASEVDQHLSFTSIERMTDKRQGKIYIDFLQNRLSATLAAPYSLRPRPGATVSMPLYREEVRKGLKPTDFTIENALDRLKSEGDIFKPVLGKGINLKKVLQLIE